MKYKLLEHANPDKLSAEVELLLTAGWELYGSPSGSITTSNEEQHVTYCQALIKK